MKKFFSVWQFLLFFFLVAFAVSCSFLLFFSGAEIPYEIIWARAGITFLNVLFISALLTAADVIRRQLTVNRPVKRILEATQRISQGDYAVRIQPLGLPESLNSFDLIIRDFNRMAAELSSVETLRTDFLANVSHELKTPLAVIRSYAVLLQREDLPQPDRLEYAKAIADASDRFSDLISNILRLNKLENQQIFPKAELYDLSEQLCTCLLQFEEVWEGKGIILETNISENVLVCADSELMSIVWNNIFSNALKFTDEGGVVAVTLEEQPDCLLVSVSDTGCGMTAQVGQHIFDKFYQGDPSHSAHGNGLGLALVKRIIDITGSDISVNSQAGSGSTFTVCMKRNKKI